MDPREKDAQYDQRLQLRQQRQHEQSTGNEQQGILNEEQENRADVEVVEQEHDDVVPCLETITEEIEENGNQNDVPGVWMSIGPNSA